MGCEKTEYKSPGHRAGHVHKHGAEYGGFSKSMFGLSRTIWGKIIPLRVIVSSSMAVSVTLIIMFTVVYHKTKEIAD